MKDRVRKAGGEVKEDAQLNVCAVGAELFARANVHMYGNYLANV